MDNGFTPTTDQVLDRYADARVGIGEWTRFDESVKRAVDEAYAEFDRWLARVKAEARVEVLEDLAHAHYTDGPQSTYDTIMRYADRTAREAGIEIGAEQ